MPSVSSSAAVVGAPPQERLWHYIAYYGMSELAQRATRIVTTILIARLLSPVDLGIAAAAITCFELMRIVANTGIGQAVIRAPDAELAGTCITARRLNWTICIGLAVAQTAVGAAVANTTGRSDVLYMIAALSGVYLMMPLALVQTYLTQRAANHAAIAKVGTIQALADNVLTVLLALLGCGAWSIVLPKLVTCPIWVVGMRRATSWNPDKSAVPVASRRLLRFSLPVLGAELLTAARLQLDKVLVGAVLGVEALGIYYFVFNAGIGLSLSLTSALANALFPHFAQSASSTRKLLQRFDRSLVHNALPVAALILTQAALAPFYVPILFGSKWTASAWLVATLCASASAKAFADTAAQALRAAGATRFELFGTLVITIVSLCALALGLFQGLTDAVLALSVVSAASQLAFTVFARSHLARASIADRSLHAAGANA